jgi:hypothetical protein
MNSKILLLAACVIAASACLGGAFALVPAIAAVLPAPAFLAGTGIGAGLGMIMSVVLISTRLQRGQFTAIMDEESAMEAPAGRAPISAFFADLELPPRTQAEHDYQPSFDSVMFALSDFEPTRGNALDRTKAEGVALALAVPTEQASPVAPDLAPIAQDVERPLQNVAGVSPFGPGTEGAKQQGSLSIEGGGEVTLADMADAFGQEEDDRVLPQSSSEVSSPPPRAATQSISPLGRLPRAAASPPETLTRPDGTSANEQIDSVALFSEMFGSVDEPSQAQIPALRGGATPRVPMAPSTKSVRATGDDNRLQNGARHTPEPFKPAIEARRPIPVPRAVLADATPQRSGALAGLRSVRPSTSRPAVPVSAVEAASRPAFADRAPVADQATPAPQPDVARQARKNRPTAEQRVITARLQMGMLRNHADDARSEFKKGQVPTPRKNAPSNLIMLSKRPEDFEHAATSEDEIRQLYREFVAALNRCGRSAEIVQYAPFAHRIQTQRRRVRAQFDGAPVNMVVRVSEGRPKIVMRPAV